MEKIMARVKKDSKLTTARLSISILGVLVLLFAATAGHAWHVKPAHSTAAASNHGASPKQLGEQALSKMSLVFEPNVGQTDSRVKFMARGAGYAAFLTGPSQAVLKIRNSADKDESITMNLAGANAEAKGGAIEKTGGVSHYYNGSDPSKWHENVPNYAKVRYDDVYPGVDVVYQGDNSRFRYDFVLKPHADPKSIRLTFDGTEAVKLDPRGSLVLAVKNSDFYLSTKPVIYQEVAGGKRMVDGAYVLNGNEVGFKLGNYDPSQALVIDPQFTAGTYLGITTPPAGQIGNSHINAVANGTNSAVNGSGSVFVTGYTLSTTFPVSRCVYAERRNLRWNRKRWRCVCYQNRLRHVHCARVFRVPWRKRH